MPLQERDWRMAAGWVSYSTIMGSTSYRIVNFAVQSDMVTSGREWYEPEDGSDLVEEVAELVDSLDHSRGGYGLPEMTITLQALSPLGVKFIVDTFWGSGIFSANMTVAVPNRATGATEVYQGIARRGLFKDSELVAGGLGRFSFDLVNMTYLPPAPDAFTEGFSFGFE